MTVMLYRIEFRIVLEEILFPRFMIYEHIYGDMKRMSLEWLHWFLLLVWTLPWGWIWEVAFWLKGNAYNEQDIKLHT